MKKVNVALLALIGLFLFFSCSKDDDYEKTYSTKISKIYRGNELNLTLNTEVMNGRRVLFVTKDLQQAEVALIKAIPGEDSIVFSGLLLEKMVVDSSEPAYSFTGESISQDRTITLSGNLIGSKMNVMVTHTVTSPIVSSWDKSSFSSVNFKIAHPNPDAVFNMHGLLGAETLPLAGSDDSFEKTLPALLGMFISILSPTLDLHSNGDAGLSWKGSSILSLPEGKLPDRYLRYNVKEDSFFLSIALDSILGGISVSLTDLGGVSGIDLSKVDIKTLLLLAQNAYTGMPLNYHITEATKGSGAKQRIEYTLHLTVTKEMMLPYITTVAPLLPSLLKGVDWTSVNNAMEGVSLGLSEESIMGFFGEFIRVMNESEQFDISFSLAREVPVGAQ